MLWRRPGAESTFGPVRASGCIQKARKAVDESDLSKRELIRRLGTSASQFYRLLDPAYYGKSVEQMLTLLRLLGREVDLVIRRADRRRTA